MKQKLDEEFNHDADFAEIISMLTRIPLKEKISHSGINGKPFDYRIIYDSVNEQESMARLVEKYEQKEKEKRQKEGNEENDKDLLGIQLNAINELTLSDSGKEMIRSVIKRQIDKEYAEYKQFIKRQYNAKIETFNKEQGIYTKGMERAPRYFRKTFNKKGERIGCQELTATQIFLDTAKVNLEVQKIYRNVTKVKNGSMSTHCYLTAIFDYLYSFTVTTKNNRNNVTFVARLGSESAERDSRKYIR